MGMNWGLVSGLLTNIAPIIGPIVTGPVGAILKAVSTSIVIVENFVHNHKGEAKKKRAVNLVMSLLTVAEEATAKDLVSNQRVVTAVESVIDLEVALRNAHAKLGAVVKDIEDKRAADGASID